MNTGYNSPVIVSFDGLSRIDAISCAKKLDPVWCRARVGMELFMSAGPVVVKDLQALGFDVFLDLQLKGSPGAVAGAVRAACILGVWMFSVHADGGTEMMQAAMNIARQRYPRPRVIAVTVPAGMNADDLEEVGVISSSGVIGPQVLRLARLAVKAGLDGVYAPGPKEARLIRGALEKDSKFLVVLPNVRMPNGGFNEQQRIVTPEGAITASADYFVVGEPITKAIDPMATLSDFNAKACSAQALMP